MTALGGLGGWGPTTGAFSVDTPVVRGPNHHLHVHRDGQTRVPAALLRSFGIGTADSPVLQLEVPRRAIAMAKKQSVQFIDDLDGAVLDEFVTIRWALDGKHYEFDTSPEHAAQFRKAVDKYLTASRRVNGTGKTNGGRPAATPSHRCSRHTRLGHSKRLRRQCPRTNTGIGHGGLQRTPLTEQQPGLAIAEPQPCLI